MSRQYIRTTLWLSKAQKATVIKKLARKGESFSAVIRRLVDED